MKDKTDDYWRSQLTEEQYRILREKGTEAPFSGDLVDNKDEGVYRCAACQATLFTSDVKYDSGSGWPSFTDVVNKGVVELQEDKSHGMVRTEVLCSNCGGHLGHLFSDGPTRSGERYCINSTCLSFRGEEDEQ